MNSAFVWDNWLFPFSTTNSNSTNSSRAAKKVFLGTCKYLKAAIWYLHLGSIINCITSCHRFEVEGCVWIDVHQYGTVLKILETQRTLKSIRYGRRTEGGINRENQHLCLFGFRQMLWMTNSRFGHVSWTALLQIFVHVPKYVVHPISCRWPPVRHARVMISTLTHSIRRSVVTVSTFTWSNQIFNSFPVMSGERLTTILDQQVREVFTWLADFLYNISWCTVCVACMWVPCSVCEKMHPVVPSVLVLHHIDVMQQWRFSTRCGWLTQTWIDTIRIANCVFLLQMNCCRIS